MTNSAKNVTAFRIALSLLAAVILTSPVAAQTAPARGTAPAPAPAKPGDPAPARAGAPATPAAATTPVVVPPGYVIGAEDQLSIVYWRDKDMTTDVVVRPDGKITLALLNDVDAAGLTPEQLGARLTEKSREYIEDPNVTVIVKQINSRKVYIMGAVGKTGPFPLTGPTTIMQLISMAGGLGEYADSKNITILRVENGKQITIPFNYNDIVARKKLSQNIELKPGDTVIVP